jgi:hypothetical protein
MNTHSPNGRRLDSPLRKSAAAATRWTGVTGSPSTTGTANRAHTDTTPSAVRSMPPQAMASAWK